MQLVATKFQLNSPISWGVFFGLYCTCYVDPVTAMSHISHHFAKISLRGYGMALCEGATAALFKTVDSPCMGRQSFRWLLTSYCMYNGGVGGGGVTEIERKRDVMILWGRNCQLRARRALMLFNSFSLRTRRVILPYTLYSDSPLLLLNKTSLTIIHALLTLTWRTVAAVWLAKIRSQCIGNSEVSSSQVVIHDTPQGLQRELYEVTDMLQTVLG